MTLTEDQIIALGQFCETLMQSDAYNAVHEMFKKQCIDAVFNSASDAHADRERVYTELHGVSKFNGLMTTLVQQRAQIIARNDQSSIPDYPEGHPVEGDLGTMPL